MSEANEGLGVAHGRKESAKHFLFKQAEKAACRHPSLPYILMYEVKKTPPFFPAAAKLLKINQRCYNSCMSGHKSKDELDTGWKEFDRPEDGQVYQHYKGGKYEVVTTGFLEDGETPCVIYRSLADGNIWVRTATNFLETTEVKGKRMPRFRPVEAPGQSH